MNQIEDVTARVHAPGWLAACLRNANMCAQAQACPTLRSGQEAASRPCLSQATCTFEHKVAEELRYASVLLTYSSKIANKHQPIHGRVVKLFMGPCRARSRCRSCARWQKRQACPATRWCCTRGWAPCCCAACCNVTVEAQSPRSPARGMGRGSAGTTLLALGTALGGSSCRGAAQARRLAAGRAGPQCKAMPILAGARRGTCQLTVWNHKRYM